MVMPLQEVQPLVLLIQHPRLGNCSLIISVDSRVVNRQVKSRSRMVSFFPPHVCATVPAMTMEVTFRDGEKRSYRNSSELWLS